MKFRKSIVAGLVGVWALLARGCGDGEWIGDFAYGHDHDVPFAAWLRTRKQPDNPIASCCGVADQVYLDEYFPDPEHPGGFRARAGALWFAVPPEKVDWTSANPTGRGVLYYTNGTNEFGATSEPYVFCFIPASGV